MDWGTHIVLSAKLLESCGLDKGAAIYSDLPAIDIKPAHYHRVYAHILENLPGILDAALDIFGGNDTNQEEYAYIRIREEEETFRELARKAGELLNDNSLTKISTDKMSAGVSLISHIYLDTFNNPVQVFLPHSSKASAQWDFWDDIDYMKFRGEFYSDENIIEFRREVAQSKVWNVKLSGPALIKAMIIRIGEMAEPAIHYDIIDNAVRKFLRYMDVNDYQRSDAELAFCLKLEDAIIESIKVKFGKKG